MNPSGPQPRPHAVAVARPQVSIERLPTRRQNNEPRESMNCKSCRKRKTKCNRLRPACEACQIFQCACIYDAVPKKRGPKTDVLEALLKRVDGLEAKLKDKKAEESSSSSLSPVQHEAAQGDRVDETQAREPPSKRVAPSNPSSSSACPKQVLTASSPVQTDAFLHTYFSRFHGKPFYILDEPSVRQRMQLLQLPDCLCHAIWAVAARHTAHPQGRLAAVRLSEDYAASSRRRIDNDEPSIHGLQALLLLILASISSGKGRKAHMLMASAIGMATALELHREMDSQSQITPAQRELRRRLFWTCYLLDRFLACGSKRPSLIRDKSVALRLPVWFLTPTSPPIDGEFFQRSSALQHIQGTGMKSQSSTGMLVDITRILGITNKYLAAGGVRGDSHFPWHSLSTLSKIRRELDSWASGTGHVFSSLHALFRLPESTILMLSKLIYHLIHCLVYRPFLPIDLAELCGNGQTQSWQIEATNMCFMHANAIAELIHLGRQSSTIEWPALVGYCICTAATVHIHGAHYSNPSASGEINLFSSSAELLSREMQQLSELQYAWTNVHHQRETLQDICNAHGELVKALAGNATMYTPGFHLEDFFDRYVNIGGPGGKTFRFDPAHLSLTEAAAESTVGPYSGNELLEVQGSGGRDRSDLKRKRTASPNPKRLEEARPTREMESQEPDLPPPATISYQTGELHPSSGGPGSLQPHVERTGLHHYPGSTRSTTDHAPPSSTADTSVPASAYGISSTMMGTAAQGLPALTDTGFSTYGYGSGGYGSASVPHNNTGHAVANDGNNSYDAIFGTLSPNAFGTWHGDDRQHHNNMSLLNSKATVLSPGAKSTSGSTGTTQTDEKDPFLSLLEQLAEEEQRVNNGPGGELDLFLTGMGASS